MGICHMLSSVLECQGDIFRSLRILNPPLSLRHLLTLVNASYLPDVCSCSPWTARTAISLDQA